MNTLMMMELEFVPKSLVLNVSASQHTISPGLDHLYFYDNYLRWVTCKHNVLSYNSGDWKVQDQGANCLRSGEGYSLLLRCNLVAASSRRGNATSSHGGRDREEATKLTPSRSFIRLLILPHKLCSYYLVTL
jgi:hypothetical protein